MKNNKKRIITSIISFILICSLMILAASALTGCGGKSGVADDDTEIALATPELTKYDVTDATAFVFSDSGIEVAEGAYSGYKLDGTALAITEGGTYVVSGSCANGSIVVKKNVTGVTLVLNGLTLSASATAPITCNKGSEVLIVAETDTVNNLADDEFNNDDVYTDEEQYPDIENAVIKCKDGSNVTICGTGTINVTANGKNGVKGGYDLYEEDEDGNATETLISEASLTVKEVTLNITASVNDGLKSDKVLNILSGNITVSAADDGIKSDYVLNIGSEGYVGPTINVTESYEGIEAATLNIYTGNITVCAEDDGINAANSDLENYEYSYNQYGGYVHVDVTAGDGIDSNGTLNLYGGVLEIYSPSQGDGDPLDSDNGTYFSGATVLAVGHLGMQQGYNATTPYVTFGSGGNPGAGQSTAVTAGSTVTVTDSDGNVLYSATAVRDASYVLFASPKLESGETYTLNCDGSAVATATASTASAGGMGMGGNPPDGGNGNPPDGGSGNPPEPPASSESTGD
ncbi:MAG: carbohydrate-binding domain-containing protein [Clostridia bacterium]|nr:carbohydrate-binding domain-containing protein [Clostridia bacterium]